MRKILLIIVILISSFSYYGAVNEKGERVINVENVVQEQEFVDQEQQNNENAEIVEDSKEKENNIAEDKKEEIKANENKVETTKQTANGTEKQKTRNTNTKTATISKNTTNTTSQSNNSNANTTKQEDLQNYGYTEKEVQVAIKTECVGNNHKISAGNTGKWFDTKAEADSFYNAEIEKWGKKWENDEIDKTEYLQKCPSGYEMWTCPQCQKWTINFYYR